MSTIAENLQKLVDDRDNIAEAIASKGVEVPANSKLSEFPEMIEGISGGGEPEWLGDTWYINRGLNGISGSFYIVFNDELYLIGGSSSNGSDGYWRKLVNGEWNQIGSLPYKFTNGSAVVYNNQIHILGGASSTNHYKWNGSSWVKVSTLPYDYFRNSGAIVYNNEIHILGSDSSDTSTNHYKWNGTSWVRVSTLPYQARYANVVVYNNEIHLMGTSHNAIYTNHYKWNGSSWVKVSTLPTSMASRNQAYTNKNYIIFENYKWNGTSWEQFDGYGGNMCFNGYLIGSGSPISFHADNYY